MKIEVRKPQTEFEFEKATTAWFHTPGGKEYALRIWFWLSASIFIVFLLITPFLMPAMAVLTEVGWQLNQATKAGETMDPSVLYLALGKALPAYLFLILGVWIATSMSEAAFYRKYLTGEEPARIPIRFNRFALRNMLAQLGFYLILFFSVFLISFLLGFLTGLVGIISKTLAVVLMFFVIVYLFVLTVVIIPVRFAPAAALTALKEKLCVFSAKNITKNRFWSLLGAYLVTYVGGYLAYYIVYIIVMISVSGNPDFLTAVSGLSPENPAIVFESIIERTSNPLILIVAVFGMAAIAAAWAAWMLWIAGVSAYAVRLWEMDGINQE